MLQHRDIVSLDFLLDLKNVDAHREFFKFAPRYGINETGLSDTVSADQPILAATDQFQRRTFQQSLATYNDCKIRYHNVLVEGEPLVMANLWRRDLVLVAHKFRNFLVKCVSLLSVLLFNCSFQFATLKLGILVGFSLVDASKRIQKIVILDNSLKGHLIELVQNDRVNELICNYCIALFNADQLLFKQSSRNCLANFSCFKIAVSHAVSQEVANKAQDFSWIAWAVFLDELRHVSESVISKRLALNVLSTKSFDVSKVTCR